MTAITRTACGMAIALALCGGHPVTASAQEKPPEPATEPSEFEAMVAVLAPEVARNTPAPAFKAEQASIYAKPYLADDTKWEKAARTTWYSGQIPVGFPTTGTVEVLYLSQCTPEAFAVDWMNKGEWSPDMRAAAETALIRQALVARGLDAAAAARLAPAKLEARATSQWNRDKPDPALKTLNAALQSAYEAGKLTQRIAVFEPFCPPTQRGTYAQAAERYQAAVAKWKASDGPVPPPPLPPPPPPPPPPPAYYAAMVAPVDFRIPSGAEVWIASELTARICEMKTGAPYRPACGGYKLYGTGMTLTGVRYRFYMERPGKVPKQGTLNLNLLPRPIDLGE